MEISSPKEGRRRSKYAKNGSRVKEKKEAIGLVVSGKQEWLQK